MSAQGSDLSSLAFALFREDAAGTVLSDPAPVMLSASVLSQTGYQRTIALRGDIGALMASTNGAWAVRVQTPTGFGTIRPAGSVPSSLPQELSGYAASVTAGSDQITLTLMPLARSLVHREYVYTYVNEYGEESAPSEAGGIDAPETGGVNLTLRGQANDQGYCPVSRIRLYRAETGLGTTSYLYHSEHANAPTVTVTDTLSGDALGAPLQTSGFYPT